MKRSTVGTSSQASKRQRVQASLSSATTTGYRDYLKFFLLRELLAALENDTPKQSMTDEEAAFFAFITHLEVGLAKFEEPSIQAKSAANRKPRSKALSLLETEYQLTYIFICILRYKSKSPRNGWTNSFPYEFIAAIKNIKNNKSNSKSNNNTFSLFCKALGKEKIKYFFSQIQEDPIGPESLRPYKENEDYKIPDKDTLLRERNKKEIFRVPDVEGKETFSQYILKYGSPSERSVPESIPARVSSSPFQSSRESSRMFSANTGLSFFNSHHPGITTIERAERDGNIGTAISEELPIRNTEKEGLPSSNLILREPELREDVPPYHGSSMLSDFLDWLETNPLIPLENRFELSSIPIGNEMMPLNDGGEKSYLVEQPSTLFTPLLSSETAQNSPREKGSSESTAKIYRNYLKLTLLRELLLSLEKDAPEYFATDEDEEFFEFIWHFEVGLTKLREFYLGGNAKKSLKISPIIEAEYQLTYIFICILRYKDRGQRNEWVKSFIPEFMCRIRHIRNIRKLNASTFYALCEVLTKKWIEAKFVEIQGDPIAPKDLCHYAKDGCYEVPDEDILMQERSQKSIFRTRVEGGETFLKYLLKYGCQEEPRVQTVAETQVSHHSFQPEGENSSVFTANTEPSFFNGNPPDTTMIERPRESELSDGGPYNGLSRAPDFPDWLGGDPLASPERGFELSSPTSTEIAFFNSNSPENVQLTSPESAFELSSIFAEDDEVVSQEGQRENSTAFTTNTEYSFFNSDSSQTTRSEIVQEIGFANTF